MSEPVYEGMEPDVGSVQEETPSELEESDHHDELRPDQSTLFENQTDEFWERLLAFAERRRQRHGNRAARLESANGLLNEAVTRVLSGTRLYDGRDPFDFMCSVIDSVLSHDATRAGNRHPHLAIARQRDDDRDSSVFDVERRPLPQSGDEFETRILRRERIERFASELAPDLQEYVRVYLDDRYTTDEERAAVIGTTVEDLRNRMRRLKRRAKELQQQESEAMREVRKNRRGR
ncbi:MAG TPA: hypothetical protein VFO89_06375 [Thermoanaerobaculia bacterium]|nr:hypothetical protein [Thermoanaerobaculia bacterium]